MYLIMVAILIVGAGLLQHNVILGASLIICGILIGDWLQRLTGGDDWLMGIVFLVGIVSIPAMLLWHLLTP